MSNTKFLILYFGSILLTIAVCLAIAFFISKAQCYAQYSEMGMECRWGVLSGCQVKQGNSWIPSKNFRVFGDE